MNQDRRAHYLERAALRAARKALQKHHGTPLTRDELLHLRIQSVEPWKRILLALVGTGVTGLGVWFLVAGKSASAGICFTIFGTILLLIGIAGRRRTVETCLDQVGSELAEAVLKMVIHALDGL